LLDGELLLYAIKLFTHLSDFVGIVRIVLTRGLHETEDQGVIDVLRRLVLERQVKGLARSIHHRFSQLDAARGQGSSSSIASLPARLFAGGIVPRTIMHRYFIRYPWKHSITSRSFASFAGESGAVAYA
jgi:hypothetical protein